MTAESNPLFASQWHLNAIGDIQSVWADYSGAGVSVGVYDDGVERTHPDLNDNYDATLHYSGIASDDGQPDAAGDGHGTSVAGIIAGENNAIGGVGIAFEAGITGVDFLNHLQNISAAVTYDALDFAANFDVMNNSWGSVPTYNQALDIMDPGTSGATEEAVRLAGVVSTGRDGLGTIIVKAAGNEANDSGLINDYGVLGNAQGDGFNSLHTVITVAAVGRSGAVESYSNWGANILIAAPAASTTTDRTGAAGYDNGDYTNTFGGTSAATPVISGVVALMLDANPNLGWRDVQNILALSAAHTGSDFGDAASGYEREDWFANGAGNWNGGGLSFNLNYGFGLVDVFSAVRMAELWTIMNDAPATSANQVVLTASFTGPAMTLDDNATTQMALNVAAGVIIEHVYVTISYTHTYPGDLDFTLVAPDGTAFTLFDQELGGSDFSGDWTFGVTAAYGMSTEGTWTLRATDNASGDTGTLNGVSLEFLGAAPNADSLYHFTDDFLSYAQTETARQTITDTDGGTDWVNLAAVTGNVALDLAVNGALAVSASTWATFSNGQDLENVALGDGNDHVTGNIRSNQLTAGRGADTLLGEGGHDTLLGGLGDDSLLGGTGADSLEGQAGDDTLKGDSSTD
ncbi:MAG TPA: serine peptidase, partial [Aliiroseovarius sp.]|nr:serine peptidase [Aliiroseovarius sp.]